MTDYVMYSYDAGTVTATVFIDLNQFITNLPLEDYQTNRDVFNNNYTAHILIRPNEKVSTNPPESADAFSVEEHESINTTPVTPVTDPHTNEESIHEKILELRSDAIFEYQIENKLGGEQCGHSLHVTHTDTGTVTTHLSVPRSHFLHAIQRIRRLNKPLPSTVAKIIDVIFPQDNEKSALNRFDRNCDSYLHPTEHLELANIVIEHCPALYTYRSRADEYVAQYGLGMTTRALPDRPIDYTDLIETYNSYDNLPRTSKSEVQRRAIINTFDDDHTDYLPVYPHETLLYHLQGDTWTDGLDPQNTALLAALLYESGDRTYALEIAGQLETPLPEHKYESHRNTLHEYDDKERSSEILKLLPHLPGQETNEIKTIFGKTLYWIAGDISINEHAKYQSHILYNAASSLLEEAGETPLAETATARATYLLGTHHEFNHRVEQAKQQYFTVIEDLMYGDSGFTDSYSVFSTVENLVSIELEQTAASVETKATPPTGEIESSIETLSRVKSLMPHQGVLLSEWKETFRKETQQYLDAALAELTGLKLQSLADTDSGPSPTVEQIQSQYRSALDGYETIENEDHVTRIKNRLHTQKIA